MEVTRNHHGKRFTQKTLADAPINPSTSSTTHRSGESVIRFSCQANEDDNITVSLQMSELVAIVDAARRRGIYPANSQQG
jgi:hypothetical protein